MGRTNPFPVSISSQKIVKIKQPRKYHKNKLKITAIVADSSNINCKNLFFITYFEGISNSFLYSFTNNTGIIKKVNIE